MKSSEKASITYIETKEQKRLNEARETGVPWKKWGHISANASGGRFVKTTARTEMRGTTSITTRPVRALIAGVKMVWQEIR